MGKHVYCIIAMGKRNARLFCLLKSRNDSSLMHAWMQVLAGLKKGDLPYVALLDDTGNNSPIATVVTTGTCTNKPQFLLRP